MYNYNPYPIRNGITWVQGIEGAKAFQLAPNSNTVLMDSENDNTFYIKVCDNVGMCSLRTFKYTEVVQESTPKLHTEDFVTRAEFNELLKELGGLNNGKQSLSTVKSADTEKPNDGLPLQ